MLNNHPEIRTDGLSLIESGLLRPGYALSYDQNTFNRKLV